MITKLNSWFRTLIMTENIVTPGPVNRIKKLIIHQLNLDKFNLFCGRRRTDSVIWFLPWCSFRCRFRLLGSLNVELQCSQANFLAPSWVSSWSRNFDRLTKRLPHCAHACLQRCRCGCAASWCARIFSWSGKRRWQEGQQSVSSGFEQTPDWSVNRQDTDSEK